MSLSERRGRPLILVVDDDAAMRLLCRTVLESEDWDVEEAVDGSAALLAFELIRPDIVLLDVVMPGMDGFTVCSRLRCLSGGETVPVMMMTGLDDTESIQRAYEVGSTDFIPKPVNWLILGHRVRYILRASRTFEDLFVTEARNRALLDAIPDDMLRIGTEGTILETRGKGGTLLIDPASDDGPGEELNKNAYEVFPAQIAEKVMKGVHDALDTGEVQVFECERQIDGDQKEWELRVVKSGDAESLVIVRDISKRKETERALRESEERYALASLAANDGLWDWNLKTNQVLFSNRWKSMLGYGDDEVGGAIEDWFSRIHPGDLDQVKVDINSHLEGIASHFSNEHRVLHKDGTYRWMLARGVAVRDSSGSPYRMAGSQSDITTRKSAEGQLLHDAFYDALTGLPNRALFTDRLGHALKRAKRTDNYSFVVLFLDLDRFKVVNDSLGHMAGDALLVETARKIEKCVRPGDTVGRLGGDEFVILCDDVKDVTVAERIAERIQENLKVPFTVEGAEIFTTASIGIALCSLDYERPEDMLRDADITMYRAKAAGKARYAIFDASMRQQAVALLRLETDLRRAVESEEFRVYYQPIVSLETDAIVSLEALIRWQHPQRGLLPPAEFISFAEETNLIIPIGYWVLKTVCTQMKKWQNEYSNNLRVAVNVSSVQLRQPDFAEGVTKIIKDAGINPNCLDLEITESVMMDHGQVTVNTLNKLRDIGIQVCLDDFGTGYSSLSYLPTFPVDVLKIDRSFIDRITAGGEQAKIIETILLLGKSLNIEVIAEGIETDDQLAHLKAIQCHHGQGFLFSKPVDSKTVEKLFVPVSSREKEYGMK
jgi:diguanylate cyclase (GGDEF)-like protein/PAS domain S-box-containing protein